MGGAVPPLQYMNSEFPCAKIKIFGLDSFSSSVALACSKMHSDTYPGVSKWERRN